MSVARAYPWLTLPQEADGLDPGGWIVEEVAGDTRRALPDSGTFLSAVDFMTRLWFTRTVAFDRTSLGRVLSLQDAPLALLVTVASGQPGGRRRRKVCSVQIEEDGSADEVTLAFGLDGSELASDIVIETTLVLARPRSGGDALAAHESGSILWSDRWRRSIEGNLPMLPMRSRDDDHTDWLWRIEFKADEWDIPLSAALVVEINEKRPDFIRAAEEANEDVIQILGAAIASVVLRRYLDDRVWQDAEDFDEGTCGHTAEDWMAQAFHGQRPETVRELAEGDPARFEAAVQAAFDTYKAGVRR